MCRFQYTAFANLVQETRRWQWYSEGSWEFTSDLRLSGELLLAETEVPRWGTSPSYPPSEVIDLSRRIQASNPAWSAGLTHSLSRRLEEDGDGLDYRSVRAHLGLGGYECEALVPNRYDSTGRIDFDWQTLRDHAGQGPCRYWIPFSNGLIPDERVPRSSNPDFESQFDHRNLTDYLIMSRGFAGSTSLTSVDAVLNGDSAWRLPGGAVSWAAGAHLRREGTSARGIHLPAAGLRSQRRPRHIGGIR